MGCTIAPTILRIVENATSAIMGCIISIKRSISPHTPTELLISKPAEVSISKPDEIKLPTMGMELPTTNFVALKIIPSNSDEAELCTVMKMLKTVCVSAPVHTGDIVAENIADTGVNVVATKDVEMV